MTNLFDIGDRHEIYLDSLTYSNSAVGRIGNIVTFVEDGVAGDTVLTEITKIKRKNLEAKALTNRFRDELVTTDKYKVIERGKMDEILQEQAFQQTGCTSDECAVEVDHLFVKSWDGVKYV